MLIRSIYGETPEGAVPVEDRGPNREIRKVFRRSKASWGGAPTKRNAKSISPSKASWVGPRQIGFRKANGQKQVGVAETAPRKASHSIRSIVKIEQQQDIFKLKISYCCFSECMSQTLLCLYYYVIFSISISRSPVAMASPFATVTCLIIPLNGACIVVSIFIASVINNG